MIRRRRSGGLADRTSRPAGLADRRTGRLDIRYLWRLETLFTQRLVLPIARTARQRVTVAMYPAGPVLDGE